MKLSIRVACAHVGAFLLLAVNVALGQDHLYSGSSGDYTQITWYRNAARTGATGTPTTTSILHIGNGHDVTIHSSGSIPGNTLTVAGIEVHDTGSGGTLYIGSTTNTALNITITGDVIINSAGRIYAGGDGGGAHNVSIGGNLTNNNILDAAVGGDVFNVTFNGTSTKTISGTGSRFEFNNLTLNASGNNLNIHSSIEVNGELNFAANGLLIVNSTSNITLGNTATIVNYNNNRYIQLDGAAGSFSQLVKGNNNTHASWRIVYPIGTAMGGYTPFDLSTATMTTTAAMSATLAVKPIYNASVTGRLRRQFRITIAGNVNATTFTNAIFGYNASTDVSSGDAIGNYTTLWYLTQISSTPTWSAITGTAPGSGSFTAPSAAQSLQTGTYYYTIGSSAAYSTPSTWYSYQTGVWSNPNVWTQDATGTVFTNPSNQSPAPGDRVTIRSGTVITADVNTVALSTTTIQTGATFDMAVTSGNNLGTISGAGLLRTKSATLPLGTYQNFVNTSGGTIEYYDIGGTLPTAQTTYNNLLLTNSTNSAITFITASNLTIRRNLTVQQTGSGTVTWQVNNTANARRTMTIGGDLTLSANARIRVGTGNEASTLPHSLTINGSLTNNGSVKFFDDTDTELFDSEYNGSVLTNELQGNAVSVTFAGASDATLTCNGQTDFYRLIVNKGASQLSTLTIASSTANNFRLFGPNNLGYSGTAPSVTSNNAMSIQNGTLKLTGAVTIPNLNEGGGSTVIPQTGALWINSADVLVNVTSTDWNIGANNRGLEVYGLLKLSGGTITTGYSQGTVCGGQLQIEGGIFRTWQVYTAGSSNTCSYKQTGGEVKIGTLDTDGESNYAYPRFALPYSTSRFEMSGGVLNVGWPTRLNAAQNGGIMINSSASNIAVTGGTVNVWIPDNTSTADSYIITSNAPFYDLNIMKEGAGPCFATLNSVIADDGTATINQSAQPLVIQHNLTLVSANNPTFNCNGINVTVGGDVNIQTGTILTAGGAANISVAGNWTNSGTFTPGTGTVTFNGSLVSAISGTTAFNNLHVNKTSNNVTLSGTASTTVNNVLSLTSGHIISSSTHPLEIGPSATVSGGSVSSFISGPARRLIGAGSSFVFPLGSVLTGRNRPAQISSTTLADTWTLEYVGKDPSLDGFDHTLFNQTNINKVSAFEYWNVTRAGTAAASISLNYNTGSYMPPHIGNVSNLRIVRWNGSQWDLPPGSGVVSQSGTNVTGAVTATNVTAFSPFTFGSLDSDSPLPVTWLSFTGGWVNNGVRLHWKTTHEFNNERFEIERSHNGRDFYAVGTIAGSGTIVTPQAYTFTDMEAVANTRYYYRIRQVDFDGQLTYSTVLMVQTPGAKSQRWVAYPNPVYTTDTFVLKEIDPDAAADPVTVVLVSANGLVVFRQTGSISKVNDTLKQVIAGIARGIYVLRVSDGLHDENFTITRP